MVDSPPATTQLDPVVLTDPCAIKALAHPARLAVIDEFFNGRKLTATECAEIAGLSASAMSYHLRALEKWGIVKRSESTEDGRERPWEAAGHGLRIESRQSGGIGAGESVLITRMLEKQRDEFLQWTNRRDKAPLADEGWDAVLAFLQSGVWITPDQADEINRTVEKLIKSYDELPGADHPPGTRKVRIAYSLVPLVKDVADPTGG